MKSAFAIVRAPVVLIALALAAAAHADGGSAPRPSTPPEQTSQPSEVQPSSDRQHAEDTYALGWKDVEKAKQEMADADSLSHGGKDALKESKKKSDSAAKRLRKAAGRFQDATQLDPQYHEAWNMLGYCLRKLGDTQKSFDAYWQCLRIKPDFAPAHEYLGEAYLMADNLAKAKEELAWLDSHGATEGKELAASIDVYEKAHPKGVPAGQPAPDDTSKTADPK